MENSKVSLCIIDDIRSVVEGLSAMEWESLGVMMAGTAYNGEDGLELIREMKPDIIITDIRMPRMDGLAMLRAVQEMNYVCRIILISSYTDFDYARQAVQLGAFDFVVKPFTEEDITAAVCKARDEALQDRAKLLNEEETERKLRESIPLLRQEYMEMLLRYPLSWEQVSSRWEFLDMALEPRHLAVISIEIDGFQDTVAGMAAGQIELMRFTLQNIVEETIRNYTKGMVFRSRGGRFVAVINARGQSLAMEIAEASRSHIEQYSKFTISVGVGGLAETVSGLPESSRQAEWALAHHLYTSGNGVIGYSDVLQADRTVTLPLDFKDELLLALRSGNGVKASALLEELSGSLAQLASKPDPGYLLSVYEELAASAMRLFYEIIPYPDVKPIADRFRSIRRSEVGTLSTLQKDLESLCSEGAELIRRSTLSEGQTTIYKSIDYLKANLHREVSVTECAAQVHLSPSYYSSLFKKVTGMTLTQFATAERIRLAKSMLIEGVPVQEIASAVGYEERRYFSDMFKRSTGMTPSEFRESYNSQETGSASEPAGSLGQSE